FPGGGFRTGPDGRVHAGPLPQGKLQFAAAHAGRRTSITSRPRSEDVVEGDAVTLHARDAPDPLSTRGPENRARVVGPDGVPVPLAWFVAYVLHGNGGAGIVSGSLRDGNASLGWGSPRIEWVEVYGSCAADGAPLGLGHAVLRVPEPGEFEIRLAPERRIEGRL